jgi:hypothetical protein
VLACVGPCLACVGLCSQACVGLCWPVFALCWPAGWLAGWLTASLAGRPAERKKLYFHATQPDGAQASQSPTGVLAACFFYFFRHLPHGMPTFRTTFPPSHLFSLPPSAPLPRTGVLAACFFDFARHLPHRMNTFLHIFIFYFSKTDNFTG